MHIPTIILSSLSFWCVSSLTPQENFDLLSQGITEYVKTGIPPAYLEEAAKNYQLPKLLRDGMSHVYDSAQVCFLCNLIVDLFILERKAGMSRDTMAEELEYFCSHVGIESSRVCTGVIELNVDPFVYIIDNHPNVTSNRVCGSVLQSLGCPKGDAYEWTIDIPSGVSPERPKANDTASFQILQLSDFHFDPNYTPGANAECGDVLCCQEFQTDPETPEAACGYWTDYRDADVPWHLVEETIRQVSTQEFDYVYYTGDIVSHRAWETSIANNTNVISQLYAFLKESFEVPVYPVFGNHEPHPANLWPTESVLDEQFSLQWLFQLAADQWSDLIGQDVSETVLRGGFYTVSPKPGFRIIGLNSNLCYTFNWWLIFEDRDPYGQLQWLADTLEEAEANNESVHILGHIPSGSVDSLSVWGREYAKIVDRFANTITGQFNGHTHRDEFHVFYSRSEPVRPVGVSFNGASVTPFTLSNPSYKIYDVDGTAFTLNDYEEWVFNLTLANLQPTESPQWYKLYSFIEAYGVESLDPVEVDKVLYKMAADHSLLDDYFRFNFREGDPGIGGGCDEVCQKAYLCDVATAVFEEDEHCNRFLALFDGAK